LPGPHIGEPGSTGYRIAPSVCCTSKNALSIEKGAQVQDNQNSFTPWPSERIAKQLKGLSSRPLLRRFDQLGRSRVRHPYGAGAVRLNHPRRDLVRSIGVCPASPPTP